MRKPTRLYRPSDLHKLINSGSSPCNACCPYRVVSSRARDSYWYNQSFFGNRDEALRYALASHLKTGLRTAVVDTRFKIPAAGTLARYDHWGEE